MKKKKDKEIFSFDEDGECHGYQEWYNYDDSIQYRGNRKNGIDVGYVESHDYLKNAHGFRLVKFCIS